MTTNGLDTTELLVVTSCPRCHAALSFRPVGVRGQFWFNRCSNCKYYKSWPLPKITKRIIYLDQLVISNMVKAKATEPFWSELYTTLNLSTAFQLVVCPYSDIHEDESVLSHKLRDQFKEMYRWFAGDHRFRVTSEIEQKQLLGAIRRWLGLAEWRSPPWREAFYDDPHAWSNDFHVESDFPADERWITHLRNRKELLHSDLESVRDSWILEDRKFEEDVRREGLAYGQNLVAAYRELGNGRVDSHAPPGVQPGVMLVHWLASEVRKARPNEMDPIAVVEQFFQSDEALNVPCQYIATRLWAAIAQKVRNPKGPRQPKPSDPFDVRAIATFAPYCDAMFVDNEFREMASQGNVNVPKKFKVRLFSMKSRDEFITYLDGLWSELSDAHRQGIELVFPQLRLNK